MQESDNGGVTVFNVSGTYTLPDIYARSLRTQARGHTYQAKHECPFHNYICYTSGTLKICPNLAHSTYVLKCVHCDCGILL